MRDKPILQTPLTPEKELVRAILQAFPDNDPCPDILLFRRNVLATEFTDKSGKKRYVRNGVVGQSDIWGIATTVCPKCGLVRHGIHLEIECKNETNKPTEEQALWIARIIHHGGIAFVVRPDKKTGVFNIRQTILNEVNVLCPHCKMVKHDVVSPQTGTVKTISVEEYKRLLR